MQDGLREEEVRAVGIVHEQGDSLLPARRGKRGDVRQLPVIIRAGHIGRPHIGVQCHRVHEVLRKRPDGFQAQQRHGIHRGAVYHAAAQDLPPFGAARRSIAWMHNEHPPAENNVRFVPKSCAAACSARRMGPSASKRLSVSGSSVKSRDKRSSGRAAGLFLWPGVWKAARCRAQCSIRAV